MINAFVTDSRYADTWFYGFIPNNTETAFTDNFTFDEYGETGVYKIVQVPERINGYDVIGSLEDYAEEYDINRTNGFYVYDQTTRGIEVTYRFPEDFTLKKVIYNRETAGGNEFTLKTNGYSEDAFLGVAKVQDKKTGKYVQILESAKKAEIDNIEQYLEDDGSLKIYYELDNVQNTDVDSYTLPRVKLAGTYKKTRSRS